MGGYCFNFTWFTWFEPQWQMEIFWFYIGQSCQATLCHRSLAFGPRSLPTPWRAARSWHCGMDVCVCDICLHIYSIYIYLHITIWYNIEWQPFRRSHGILPLVMHSCLQICTASAPSIPPSYAISSSVFRCPTKKKTATTTGPVFPRNAKPLVNKPGGSGLNSMVRFRPRAGRRPRTVTARFPRKQGRTRVPRPLSSGFLSRFLALTVVLATNLSHLGSWKRCLLALQLEESLLLLCWGAEVSEDGLVWK